MNRVIYLGEKFARRFPIKVFAFLVDESHDITFAVVGMAVKFDIGQFATGAVTLQRPFAHQEHLRQFLTVVHAFAVDVELALRVACLQVVHQNLYQSLLTLQVLRHCPHRLLKCLSVQFHSLVP